MMRSIMSQNNPLSRNKKKPYKGGKEHGGESSYKGGKEHGGESSYKGSKDHGGESKKEWSPT